jgi:hypothetical protein
LCRFICRDLETELRPSAVDFPTRATFDPLTISIRGVIWVPSVDLIGDVKSSGMYAQACLIDAAGCSMTAIIYMHVCMHAAQLCATIAPNR